MKLLLIFIVGLLFFVFTFIVKTIGAKLVCLFIAFFLYKWGSHQIKLIEKNNEETIKKETEELLGEFTHSQSIISPDYLNAILLDEASQTLFIVNREDTDSGFDVREYLFNEIFETSIEEDGKQTALIKRGGLLQGSMLDKENTLVYLMESEKKEKPVEESNDSSEEESLDGVSKISLKIVVDDINNPIVEYVFLEAEEPQVTDSEAYKDAAKLCRKWYQMMSIIIKRNENVNRIIITH